MTQKRRSGLRRRSAVILVANTSCRSKPHPRARTSVPSGRIGVRRLYSGSSAALIRPFTKRQRQPVACMIFRQIIIRVSRRLSIRRWRPASRRWLWLQRRGLRRSAVEMKILVLALDLAGTFVFALNGAMTAVRHRLDLFGILVLSLAAATFGGITRDLMIGAVPPAALATGGISRSLVAGFAIFFFYSAADWRKRSAYFRRGGISFLRSLRRVEGTELRPHRLSPPSCSVCLPASAAASCAMSLWRKFRPCYERIFTPSLLSPAPLWW